MREEQKKNSHMVQVLSCMHGRDTVPWQFGLWGLGGMGRGGKRSRRWPNNITIFGMVTNLSSNISPAKWRLKKFDPRSFFPIKTPSWPQSSCYALPCYSIYENDFLRLFLSVTCVGIRVFLMCQRNLNLNVRDTGTDTASEWQWVQSLDVTCERLFPDVFLLLIQSDSVELRYQSIPMYLMLRLRCSR